MNRKKKLGGLILFLCMILYTELFSQEQIKSDKKEGKRTISIEVKVLKVLKSDTILMSNPKTVIEDGSEGSLIMGRRIPVKNEKGEMEYFDDTTEIKVMPRIVPEKGIEMTIEAIIRGYDKEKNKQTISTMKKCELIGNLETIVLELMENKKDKSRMVFQFTPMVNPKPIVESVPGGKD